MIHKLRMIWRILRDKQVVLITEDHGRMYYDWNTRSLEDICHRPCIYNDKGRCDMWDELSVPDESEKCDNQIDV